MATDHLLIEISPTLVEAMEIPGEAGKVDYFRLLGIGRNFSAEDVRRGIMARSRTLRAWQNSPQHGEEAIKLLPMLHRIGAVLNNPLRAAAYAKELERATSGAKVDPLEEFQEMVRVALADGQLDHKSKAELLRYAATHQVPMNEAGRILSELTAAAVISLETTAETERQWEFRVNERELGLDSYRRAVNSMVERGVLNAHSAARMVEDGEKFCISREEASEIVLQGAARAFRQMIESVARDGVLNNNQARLLMPKAAAFGLPESRAFEVISDYTFTGASQEELATLNLSAPTFDTADIQSLLAKQKTIHYIRRFDSLRRMASALGGVGVAALILAGLGLGGYLVLEYVLPVFERGTREEMRGEAPAVAQPRVGGSAPEPAPAVATPAPEAGSNEPAREYVVVEPERPGDPPAFQIKSTEVSRAEYQKFVLDVLYPMLPLGWGSDFNFPSGTGDLPVTGIRWADAMEFCRWQAGKMKLPAGQVRLPTAKEYARLLRGGKIPGGRSATESDLWKNSPLWRWRDPAPAQRHSLVDSLELPGGVVFDLLGNVSEWGMDETSEGKAVLGGDFAVGDSRFDLQQIRYRDPDRAYPEVGFRYVIVGAAGQ